MVACAAAERLRSWEAKTAIVLGSGLNALVREVDAAEGISYSDVPDLPPSRVLGHVGKFVRGTVQGLPVVYAQGRAHLYEGHSASAVTAGVRFLAACGIERLILTNAAGTLNPSFLPGHWMMLSDHLNCTAQSPLADGARFTDLTDAYSPALRARFRAAAQQAELTLHEGVYAGVLGPQYETPAEIRMLRVLGADAVGMSTVLETIQARALGLEVAGFSCLTNWGAGLGGYSLSHDDVLSVGQGAAADFHRLLDGALGTAPAPVRPRP